MEPTNRNSKSRKQTSKPPRSTKRSSQKLTVKKQKANPKQIELLEEKTKEILCKGKPIQKRNRIKPMMRESFPQISLPRELDPVAGNVNDGLQVPTSFQYLTEENYNPFPDYFWAQHFNGYVIQADERFDKQNFQRSGRYSNL